MTTYNVAVLGATGAVGQELLSILMEREFPIKSFKVLASARSAGRILEVGGHEFQVEEATPESFTGIDLAFFSAGASVSKKFAPEATKRGAIVIDNTSAFRLEPEVPLVVPEVNPGDVSRHRGIIANPNCSTIIMVVVLAPLYREAGLKRVVVSTYQAVSGVGAMAIQDLHDQVMDYARGREITSRAFPMVAAARHYEMAFNVIPHIDVFTEGGYTKEEWKMVNETQKILHDETVRVTATTVRVPVFRSHAESVNVELKRKLTVSEVRSILAGAPGVRVYDNPEKQEYPMPILTSGRDEVWVGRIREDFTVEAGVNLWIVGDQLRKGAALNAVQIGEELIKRGLI